MMHLTDEKSHIYCFFSIIITVHNFFFFIITLGVVMPLLYGRSMSLHCVLLRKHSNHFAYNKKEIASVSFFRNEQWCIEPYSIYLP